MTTKPKKRNPADATVSNVDALKKRVAVLEKKMSLLIATIKFAILEEK